MAAARGNSRAACHLGHFKTPLPSRVLEKFDYPLLVLPLRINIEGAAAVIYPKLPFSQPDLPCGISYAINRHKSIGNGLE